MREIKNITGCCVDLDTLIALDKRATEDLKNNTHNIGQAEVITIIREFIRCKNDYLKLKKEYKNVGEMVINKRDNKVGVVLRELGTGQIQVLEKVQPTIINTHDNWNTLELLEKEVKDE